MIANSRCIACNLSKKEEKIRKHSDEKKKKEFIQKVTGILYKYGDIESTPMLDKRIQDIYQAHLKISNLMFAPVNQILNFFYSAPHQRNNLNNYYF